MHFKMQLLADIYDENVLDPNCAKASTKPDDTHTRRALKGKARGFLRQSQKPHHQDWRCKVSNTITLCFVLCDMN